MEEEKKINEDIEIEEDLTDEEELEREAEKEIMYNAEKQYQQKKVFFVPASVRQMVFRDIGKYGAISGLNKLFHLLNCIDYLVNTIGEDAVAVSVDNELLQMRETQKSKGYLSIANRYKTYADIKNKIDEIRSDLDYVQLIYDDIRDKEQRHKQETEKKIKYKKIAKRLGPYHFEIYFLFNHLMKITDLQARTIPNEAFKVPELSKYIKQPFVKETKKEIPTT